MNFKDKIAEFPNRKYLVPVEGQPNVYEMTDVPENIIQEGTVLNAQVFAELQASMQSSISEATVWHTGNSVPASDIGKEGDFYLLTTTAGIYKKESGVWAYLASIKGTTGATGAQGLQGVIGETGPKGDTGFAIPVSGMRFEIESDGNLWLKYDNGAPINLGKVKGRSIGQIRKKNANSLNPLIDNYEVLLDDETPAVPATVIGEFTCTNPEAVINALAAKQDKLISGSNIKTVNGESLLSAGNLDYAVKSGKWEMLATTAAVPGASSTAKFVITYTYTGYNPATVSVTIKSGQAVGNVNLMNIILTWMILPQGKFPDGTHNTSGGIFNPSYLNISEPGYFNNFIQALRDCGVRSFALDMEGNFGNFSGSNSVSSIAAKLENMTAIRNGAYSELKGIMTRPLDKSYEVRFYVDGNAIKLELQTLITYKSKMATMLVSTTRNATGTGQTGSIQTFVIPEDSLYTITATGAKGGKGAGADVYGVVPGNGASITASFALKKDDVITILVGQQGGSSSYSTATGTDLTGGGGGGATFVFKNIPAITDSRYQYTKNSQPFEVLLVAAGGGGTSDCAYSSGSKTNGPNASTVYYTPSSYQTPNTTTWVGKTSSGNNIGGSIQQYISNNGIGNMYSRTETVYGGYGGGACADDSTCTGGGWYCTGSISTSWSSGSNTSISIIGTGNGSCVISGSYETKSLYINSGATDEDMSVGSPLVLTGELTARNKVWLGDANKAQQDSGAHERYIAAYGKTGSSYINFGYAPSNNNTGELIFYYGNPNGEGNYSALSLYGGANFLKVYPNKTESTQPYYENGQRIYFTKKYTIDARALNTSYYYPVSMHLGATNNVRIEIIVSLAGDKPSWATHQSGFSVRKIWEVNGSGWGTTPVERRIHVSSYGWASEDPVRGITQNTMCSDEIVYIRGGGVYYFYTTHDVVPYLHLFGYYWQDGQYSYNAPYTTGNNLSLITSISSEDKYRAFQLPNGIIAQYGYVSVGATGTVSNISFPTSFPNELLSLTINKVSNDNSTSAQKRGVTINNTHDRSGFSVYWASGGESGLYYIAIGY